MKTHHLLRERLLAQAGLFPTPFHQLTKDEAKKKASNLANTEWSSEFERLMRNRLIMGSFRYGKFGSAGKGSFDSITSAIHRLRAFQSTGNLEHLVDAANLCLVEYVAGQHPLRHFNSIDDSPLHAKQIKCKFKINSQRTLANSD